MAILVTCQSVSKAFSARPLFQDITFSIEDEHRLGIIGPNGAGKSTLLKIVAGHVEPDSGNVVTRRGIRMVYVPQQESFDPEASITDIVTEAAAGMPVEAYERAASIDSTISRLQFPDRKAASGSLSGGWRKRLSLACGLVQQPDLLLIDEPTNHLDLQSIIWLEELLGNLPYPFVLISHDRAFLETVTNRIMELNPTYPDGHLTVDGSYSEFLSAREQQLSAQRNQQQALASQVRREIAWLQRGARARQTKSSGRIKQAGKLIEELSDVRQRNALASNQLELEFESTQRKAKELVVAKGIAKAFEEKLLFSDLDILLTSRSKLGLIGRNGSGKTTLLELLIGKLEPDRGEIKRAQDLKIVWFDQNREQIDQSKTLAESLSSDGDWVNVRGKQLHVATWASKFLFRSDQLRLPVSYLSGGEQARILLANIMAQPADILILDEPTNDLDIPSIEVLEETLIDFPGTIILVTHDRMMLDTVSHQLLALDGRGGTQFFSNYEQFEKVADQFLSELDNKLARTQTREPAKIRPKSESKRKSGLSSPEKRELASIPARIEALEKEIADLQNEMEGPAIASNHTELQNRLKKQEELQQRLDAQFRRWEELEGRLGT